MLKIFVSIYKVPSQPSLLQAKQAWLPQPFLIGQMLLSPHHRTGCYSSHPGVDVKETR